MIIFKEFKAASDGLELNAVEAEDLLNFCGFGGWNGLVSSVRGNLKNDKNSAINKDPSKWEKHTLWMGWGFNFRVDNVDVRNGFAKCKFFLKKVNPAFACLRIVDDTSNYPGREKGSYLDIDLKNTFETAENFIKSRNRK